MWFGQGCIVSPFLFHSFCIINLPPPLLTDSVKESRPVTFLHTFNVSMSRYSAAASFIGILKQMRSDAASFHQVLMITVKLWGVLGVIIVVSRVSLFYSFWYLTLGWELSNLLLVLVWWDVNYYSWNVTTHFYGVEDCYVTGYMHCIDTT